MSEHLQSRSFRSPRRISVTLPHQTYERLVARSDREGRSLSNLAAFLLETSISGPAAHELLPDTAGSPVPAGLRCEPLPARAGSWRR